MDHFELCELHDAVYRKFTSGGISELSLSSPHLHRGRLHSRQERWRVVPAQPPESLDHYRCKTQLWQPACRGARADITLGE